MDTVIFDPNVIMPRAQAGREAEHAKLEALGYVWFKMLASASGIAIACASEAYSLTVALKAQFEALSDGTDLGHDMMAMRPGIIAVLILAHVILHDRGEPNPRPLRRWLRRARLLPLVTIMGGMAIFMFVAASQATGGEDGGLAGLGLGIVCSSLFGISFLAAMRLMAKFLPALRSILAGRAQRAKIADIDGEMHAVDTYRPLIEARRRTIAAKEAPDTLRHNVAAEAVAIVGPIAAEAHDIRESCAAIPEDRRPEDELDGLPDVPLAALDQRQIYLKSLNVPFFINLLKNREA